MFARLTIAPKVKIDRIDEAITFFKENIGPAAKSQEGHRGIWFLVDRKTGKGISITMWDSEEDAIANEQSGYYQEQLVKFMDFLLSPSYIREGYEVVVQIQAE